MTVDHTNDIETTDKEVGKKKSSPRKTQTPKKTSKNTVKSEENITPTHDASALLTVSKTSAKKKTVARKKTTSTDGIEGNISLQTPSELNSAPAKKASARTTTPRATKASKALKTAEETGNTLVETSPTKSSENKGSSSQKASLVATSAKGDISEKDAVKKPTVRARRGQNAENAQETVSKLPTSEAKIPEKTSKKPLKATSSVRGRAKKTSLESKEISQAAETVKEKTASVDIVSDKVETSSVSVSVSEKKKPRRRVSKPKEQKTDTLQDTPVQEETSSVTSSAPLASLDEPEKTPAAVSTEDAPPSSRRGRRGGRGKRGKKRATQTQIFAEEQDLNEEAQATNEKKSVGTSLNTGKPGIAKPSTVKKSTSVQRKMFISMVQGEQVEVALVENGIIHEYYLEMLHQVKTKGNIYKGVVNNIDTNLQAAFVNYGANKNGFLQIDEIHPEYYQSHQETVKGKKFPPIQKIIKPGQEILIQVVKEPTGNKGAFLTTWLSLAGRFLVLTPGQEQIGVSRKVDNDEERQRLRAMMTGIEPGKGLGVIVRTVSAGTAKTTLKSDLQYLKRVWREIRKRGVSENAPVLLHRETSLAQRAIRDYLTDDVTEVWVDSTEVAETLRETVSLLFPRKKELIRTHADVRQTLWERFNMQRQLEQIYAREVHLPSGGRLVFDQTEALMAIDINSGKISGKGNFESMALKTNLEAAETIARHLKLRDIGGQVVIDFIEMRDRAHVREVEKTLRNAMKNDRARHDVARMSSFGLLEIVRQRTGSSALAITMEPCPHCRGTGIRRNIEWQALQALCEIERKGRSAQGGKYVYETQFPELALYLLNHKRQRITELEEQLKISIEVLIRS